VVIFSAGYSSGS